MFGTGVPKSGARHAGTCCFRVRHLHKRDAYYLYHKKRMLCKWLYVCIYIYIYIHIHTHMWIYIYNMLMFIFRAVDPQQCMADLHSVSRLWILPGNPPRYAIDDSFVDDTHDDFPMNILVISPSYVKST